jgi:hypothetical protein
MRTELWTYFFNILLGKKQFNLDTVQEGLQKLALPYKRHSALKQKINEGVRVRYTCQGKYLLGIIIQDWLKQLMAVRF